MYERAHHPLMIVRFHFISYPHFLYFVFIDITPLISVFRSYFVVCN